MFSISMEENPAVSIGRACKIIRKSVHTFLQYFQYFTTVASFIILPFSISVLISQALVPLSFSVFPTVYRRLHSLFLAAGFPPSSHFFAMLNLKLSQSITSSIIILPFTLSFFLLAKTSIIHFLTNRNIYNSNPYSFLSLYPSILSTHLCNSFIIFATNATCLSLLFLAFNFFESFHLNFPRWNFVFSAFGVVLYSIAMANTLVVCNLALVSSGIEQVGGFMSLVKACVLIRGKTSTALALAVPINLGLAAVEALFHFRIVASSQGTNLEGSSAWLVALEGVLIAYIYSFLLVLDVIMNCMFYQSCKNWYVANDRYSCVMEVEEHCYYDYNVEKLQGLEEYVQV